MTKEEVFNLIRQRLSFGDELQQQLRHVDKDKFMKEHRRFEMSGFETQTGWCTVFNNDILNKFADLGIYNYTSYIKDYCNIAISFGICSRCNDLCCSRRINSRISGRRTFKYWYNRSCNWLCNNDDIGCCFRIKLNKL